MTTWIDRLYPEQRPALELVTSRAGTMLLGDTGVGKTYVTLAAIEKLCPALTLLVVPLTSIDITWSPKLAQMPAGFEILRDVGDLPRRPPNASASSSAPFRGIILLLHMQAFVKHSRMLSRKLWDLVVIDESQVLKARNSGFSRAARRLRHARRRLALSATPIDKTPIDLFAQMRFVDHTILGDSFTAFAEEYCYRGGWKGKKWIFHKHKMDAFLERIRPAVFRLTKEFQSLPPLTITPVPVQLLGAQARTYERMQHHSVINGTTARLAVTRQVKLEQITGGAIIDDTNVPTPVGRAKERKLRSLVKRLHAPVVVFCKYLHEIPIIYQVLEERFKRVAELHGGIKGDMRTAAINHFQAGHIDALVCQVRTGGVSVEFTRSNTMIFYSFGFSLIDFEQIIGRLHRGGQTRPVTVYVLHAVDTVDDEIIAAIEDKYTIFHEVTSSIDRNQVHDTTQRIVVTAQ